MWYLDFIGLFACMRFCADSEYSEEFDFITKNASQNSRHIIVWAQAAPERRHLHVVVRIRLDAGIDWVDVDLKIRTEFLLRASLLGVGPCIKTEDRVSYA